MFAVVAVVAVLAWGAISRPGGAPSRPTDTDRSGGISPVRLSGSGSDTWGPRELPGGLYSVEWQARGSCAFSVRFETPDGSDWELAVNSVVFDNATEGGTETARLSGGRYVASIGADGCTWALTISSVQ